MIFKQNLLRPNNGNITLVIPWKGGTKGDGANPLMLETNPLLSGNIGEKSWSGKK